MFKGRGLQNLRCWRVVDEMFEEGLENSELFGAIVECLQSYNFSK